MNSVIQYKLEKKLRWINHQIAQKMLVYCYSNNRLVVIKQAKLTEDGIRVINKDQNILLKNQPIYSTKVDITNPVGTFRDRSLDVAEYVDLIVKCISAN